MAFSAYKSLVLLLIFSLTEISAQECSSDDGCDVCNESNECIWGYCAVEAEEGEPTISGSQGCFLMSNVSEACPEGEMFEVITNCSLAEETLEATPNTTGSTASPTTNPASGGTTPPSGTAGGTSPPEGATTLPQGETTEGAEGTTVGSEKPGVTDNTTQFMPSSGASFDAASFIGGIVLCGGLILIVFLGCKFYESRSKNYHTL